MPGSQKTPTGERGEFVLIVSGAQAAARKACRPSPNGFCACCAELPLKQAAALAAAISARAK